MAGRSEQIRRLTAPLRRDLRGRIRSVAERAQFFNAVEPVFGEELASAGLDEFMRKALGIDRAKHKAYTQLAQDTPQVREALRSLRRETGVAPLKYFRRQLRDDFLYVMELARVLHRLDNPDATAGPTPEEVPQLLEGLDVE